MTKSTTHTKETWEVRMKYKSESNSFGCATFDYEPTINETAEALKRLRMMYCSPSPVEYCIVQKRVHTIVHTDEYILKRWGNYDN